MIATFLAAAMLAVSVTPLPAFPDRGEPIAAEAYTEDLLEAEYINGKLATETLLAIESSEGCLLEEEAAEAWLRLEIHAANAGIELIASWCYRDLATQRRTYRRNCPRVSVVVDPPLPPSETPRASNPDEPEAPGSSVETPVTTVKGPRICSPPTAKPGKSNHGWGRAADITFEGQLLNCESAAFQWLEANAHIYGWVHPQWAACGEPKEEAWHWEWGGTHAGAPRITRLSNFTA